MPALVVALPRSREGSARDSLSSLESVPPQLDTPSADAEANAELSGIIMRRKQSMAVNLQKKQSVFEVERSGGEAGRSGGEAAAVAEEEPQREVVTFGNTPSPAKLPSPSGSQTTTTTTTTMNSASQKRTSSASYVDSRHWPPSRIARTVST